MATIRKLRGRWQAQVRRRGVAPRAKSFDSKADAQRWAQDLEAEANRSGWVADTRLAEKTTLRELLTRYCAEVTPGKRGAVSEASRINSILRCPMSHRTLAKLTSADVATYRDERLKSVAPATVIRELNTVSHAIEIARLSPRKLTVRRGFFGKRHLRLTRPRRRSMPSWVSFTAWMPASVGGTTVTPRSTRLVPTLTGHLPSIPAMPTPTRLQAWCCCCKGSTMKPLPRAGPRSNWRLGRLIRPSSPVSFLQHRAIPKTRSR